MKIKLDENIPIRLALKLKGLGHDVDTVPDENLTGCPDDVVFKNVCAEERFFITQDLDFSDIRQYAPGQHPGILLVRLRDPGRNELLLKTMEVFISEKVESWNKCFVVLTDHKLRVIHP